MTDDAALDMKIAEIQTIQPYRNIQLTNPNEKKIGKKTTFQIYDYSLYFTAKFHIKLIHTIRLSICNCLKKTLSTYIFE